MGEVRAAGAAPPQLTAVESAVRGAITQALRLSAPPTASTAGLQREIQQQIAEALAGGSLK
jgi:hypothetical protein